MPFFGDADDAAAALRSLSSIELLPGDELLVADNTPGGTFASLAGGPIRVLPAPDQRSSYYARNVAAQAAGNEWLLFIDSDCEPHPQILTSYFSEEVDDRVGAIAGEIVADRSQTHPVARYQRDREYLSQARNVNDGSRPYAVTANLLVRRDAWRSVGGFLEGIRSGGDTEFSWRLQEAGWRLAYRPGAWVVHRHRESLGSFGRVILRYSAGRAWLNRRYPGARAALNTRQSALRAGAASLRWLLAGDRERAAFRAIDVLVIVLDRIGSALANGPSPVSGEAAAVQIAVFVDRFPELSETFIVAELRALAGAGVKARVEAVRRAARQDLTSTHGQPVAYLEDESPLRKLRALAWLLANHPLASAADLRARRRWRAEEPVPPLRVIAPAARRVEQARARHLHAHFASSAALTAMRLARITGRPYSVTAHAYDIFVSPQNLQEKLEHAAFVTTGCLYNVEYLERVAPRARIHEVVMGIDGELFRRSEPYPGGRRVIAVGRLIAKKGFAHLLDAVGRLERIAPLEHLDIVGDGPLRESLRERAKRLGIDGKVTFLGSLDHASVRRVLESADLLVMPSVIASDGDRDSMPVVVKEALALEIPVVASDEVGLPELVRPEWGRLVPPADPERLAEAIAALLDLPPEERVRMGRAGRSHVIAHCSVELETAKLVRLIGDSSA